MRAETRRPCQAQQLRIQPAAIAARKEHKRLVRQRRQLQALLAAFGQWVIGTNHRHQRLTKQLHGAQRLRQHQWTHNSDFDAFIHQAFGDFAAAHFLEVQMHRREGLTERKDRLGNAGVERRR